MATTINLAGTTLDTGQVQKEVTINEMSALLDAAIAGRLAVSTTGGTTTLTGTAVAPQAQNLFIDISGTLTSNATIEIPVAAGTGRNRIYVVKNGTSGAFTLTVKKVGGTGVTVTQGKIALLLYDSSDIVRAVSDPAMTSAVAARAYHNADQSISTATPTALALNSERYDTDVIHDTSSNNSRLTCKTAGKYCMAGLAGFAAHATGWRAVYIRLNGSTLIAANRALNIGASDAIYLPVSCDYDLAINDYVELVAEQNSGGALNVLSTANISPEFMMHRIGA